MSMLTRWKNSDHLLPATLGGINELFRSVFDQMSDFTPEWPADSSGNGGIDVEVGEHEAVAKLPLPGCEAGTINVEVVGDVLKIEAERREEEKSEKQGHYIRRERSVMHYEESIRLPVKVMGHRAKAKYEDGILTVTLPREEEAGNRSHVVKVD